MRTSVSVLSSLAALGAAFPSLNPDALGGEIVGRQSIPDNTKTFDPVAQHVDITGDHAFVAPNLGGGDQRGPCPGLNAAANHGYLPHNGVATHDQFIDGTFKVFGMGADLAGFLTILGALFDGDGVSKWSIGGPTSALPGLPPLIGQPQGISASHNKYECDVSPTRGDLYQYGNAFALQMSQYQQLYDMAIANGDNIDMTLMNDFRAKRFQQSIENNPYFFNGPFTGVAVQPAAFYFIYRFMGNKSAEFPAGKLDTNILGSFFSVEKQADGTFKHTPGNERIPNNFYKRAVGDEYTIPFLIGDISAGGMAHPEFVSIGGNTGKVNTFTGLEPSNFFDGLSNGFSLLEGNNFACYLQGYLTQAIPDTVKCSAVVGGVTNLLSSLTDTLKTSLGTATCADLGKLSTDQFDQFPGYKGLNCKSGLYQ